MQINDYYQIGMTTWNDIIVYRLLALDMNRWSHVVLRKDYYNQINKCDKKWFQLNVEHINSFDCNQINQSSALISYIELIK